MGRNKPITINDIAKICGVSKTTVSHFLNGKFENMSDATRTRIDQAIKEKKYRPNAMARGLKARRTGLIGVILSDVHGAGVARTLRGVAQVFEATAYSPIIQFYDSRYSSRSRQLCLHNCFDLQVDGIIFNIEDDDREGYQEIASRGIPLVVMGGSSEQWAYEAVYVDHYAAAKKAFKHMQDNGFEKIFYLQEIPGHHSMHGQRKLAYMDFVGSTSVGGGEECCFAVELDSTTYTKSIASMIRTIMADPSPAKALFADGSVTLKLALSEILNQGVAIPEQLGLCGYDAFDWCGVIKPGITAIASSALNMAKEAARMLVERLETGNSGTHRRTILDADLVIRDSTRRKDSAGMV